MIPVPTLDALAADPSRALALPPDVRRRLALDAIALAHMLAVVEGAPVAEPVGPDRAMRLEEAAPRLGIAPKTLARWCREQPKWAECVTHRSPRKILLSASRFDAALRAHVAGAEAPRRGRGAARFPLAQEHMGV